MDSRLIFLPSACRSDAADDGTLSRSPRQGSRVPERARPICCRSAGRGVREKLCGYETRIRTKTATGRRGEYPKALERTVLKELGKLTP